MIGAENPQAYPCLDSSGEGLSMRDPGMTLLDYFAGQALPRVIQWHNKRPEGWNYDDAAEDAYDIAAAMLRQRTQFITGEINAS